MTKKTATIVGVILVILILLVVRIARHGGLRNRQNTNNTPTNVVNISSNTSSNASNSNTTNNSISSGDMKPGTYNVNLKHNGVDRSYILVVPGKYKSGAATPVIMSFHGGYADAQSQENLTHMSTLAEKEGFVLVYPQADGKNWNDGRVSEASNIDDVGFVRAIAKDLQSKLTIDAKRIYATGMSNGGFFTNRLGCEASDLFAAIAPVAGGMSSELNASCKPSNTMPAMIINGTADPIVPYNGGNVGQFIAKGTTLSARDVVSMWVRINSTSTSPQKITFANTSNDGTTTNREIYSNGKNGSEVIFLTINDGGHTWPGGTQYFPERRIGKTSRDFDANQVMWDFFKTHTR